MQVPVGMTESQVVAAIERAANILAPTFTFGSYGVDDIRQECFVFGVELMNRGTYDSSRPLDNYLYVHIRNRLINFKRNKCRRSDPPCRVCHTGPPYCSGLGCICESYKRWQDRNRAKASLAAPVGLELAKADESYSSGDDVHTNAEVEEALLLIDERLPVELRQYYLQMRDGVSVPKVKRLEVETAIKEILGCSSADD